MFSQIHPARPFLFTQLQQQRNQHLFPSQGLPSSTPSSTSQLATTTQQQQQQQQQASSSTNTNNNNFNNTTVLLEALFHQILLQVAPLAPPAVCRRLTDTFEVLSSQLTHALTSLSQQQQQQPQQQQYNKMTSTTMMMMPSSVSTLSSSSPSSVEHLVCQAAFLHSEHAIECAVRDVLLKHLATCIGPATEESLTSVAIVAQRVVEKLITWGANKRVTVNGGASASMFFNGASQVSRCCAAGEDEQKRASSTANKGDDDVEDDAQEESSESRSSRVVVALGVDHLDELIHPVLRGFARGFVHELYGEAGCGKSTWVAQLMVRALMVLNNHTKKSNKRSVVFYLCAEPPSMARIEQIARRMYEEQHHEPDATSSSFSWRQVLENLLIVDLRHVDHFEESLKILMRDYAHSSSAADNNARHNVTDADDAANKNEQQSTSDVDVPIVVLDSVAALVEKSMRCNNASLYHDDSVTSDATIDSKNQTSAGAERAEYIDRIGTGLRAVAWSVNAAVLVVNQARWNGGGGGSTTQQQSSSSSSSSFSSIIMQHGVPNQFQAGGLMVVGGGGGVGIGAALSGVQPALGLAWTSFISGTSIELSRPGRGTAQASRRRARRVRCNNAAPDGPVEFDLVGGGVS